MNPIAKRLQAALDAQTAAGRLRARPPALRSDALDLKSSDVHGLSRHPKVVAAAAEALRREGLGARAARLLGGGGPDQAALEDRATAWMGTEEALYFPSGFHANLGVIQALAGADCALFSDALNHASIIEGARLARAACTVYRHGDLQHLESLLAATPLSTPKVIVTESVFSMDGDLVDLEGILSLARRFEALVLVDEAHAIGLLGPGGRGAVAALEPAALDYVVRVLPCGKALGSQGALVVGSKLVIDYLVNHARSLLFSTAPSPAHAAGLIAAIDLLDRGAIDCTRPLRAAQRLAAQLQRPAPAAAIVPIPSGSDAQTAALGSALEEAGFLVGAVRPPTVPEGTSRLRLVVKADHDDQAIASFCTVLRKLQGPPQKLPEPPARHPAPPAPALIVAGTDTEVGKTVASALLAQTLLDWGPARYWKPIQTGEDCDTTTVQTLAPGISTLTPGARFALPASPDQAAAAEGRAVDLDALDLQLQRARSESESPLLVELAGGLLVPLRDDCLNLDWIARSGLPVVLVARAGLGTLNHTLASADLLARRGIACAGLLLIGPPHEANVQSLNTHWARITGTPMPPLLRVPPIEPLNPKGLTAFRATHDPSPLLLGMKAHHS